jgi:transcriptional regulator of acetoin/glycerol metabolism
MEPCFECGRAASNLHHVIPKCLGGTKTVPLCLECHGKVHGRDMVRMARLVRAGQEAARRNGKKWGGSKPGWRWKVSDEQATAIGEMKAEGRKVTHIARIMGLSRPTIYRVLRQCRCAN